MDDREMIDIEEHLQRSIGSEEVGMPTEKWVAVLEEMRQLRKENKALRDTKREWVGLTDEERHEIREWQEIQKELGPIWAPMMLYLYIAIEAKLKEKNSG